MNKKELIPKDTTEDRLDTILYALWTIKSRMSLTDQFNSGVFISRCYDALNFEIDALELSLLESRLIQDGYIELINESLPDLVRITSKGINFIADGGYQEQSEKEERKENEMNSK